MITRKVSEIASITGGKLILRGACNQEEEVNHIITDSRSLAPITGGMFAAIRTSIADGHSYIGSMIDKGVRTFLVERIPETYKDTDTVFIVVHSVKEALQKLAFKTLTDTPHRRIIITGSYGKTTVKELIYTALMPLTSVARSPRSWNSSIGVPLAILDMESEAHEVEITEVAIDAPGQAETLLPLLKGDIGILTAIGNQHDEAFPSHEAKIHEKLRLLSRCKTLIYPAGNGEINKIIKQEFPESLYRLVPVKCTGHSDMAHALAEAAVKESGFILDTDIDAIPKVSSRFTIREAADGNLIIRDNFTPDLRELKEALEFASRRFTRSHTPIFVAGNLLHGHMDEVEKQALYTDAISLAKSYGIEHIIGVGDEWALYGADGDTMESLTNRRPINTLILATGNSNPDVEKLLSSIESASHDTTLDVDLEALIHNYNYYRSILPQGTGIVAMVKASAYGLGATEISKTLQSHGAAYLAVAVIDEGVSLREAGITMPIMVLNPVTNRYPLLFSCHLEPAVFSIDELERLIKEAEFAGVTNYPIHLKLDTGMHRLGFIPSQFRSLIELLKSTDTVKVKSIFTHLATADCLDKDIYTQNQIKSFQTWSKEIEAALGYRILHHFLNTAGMMRFADSEPYDMTRLGIGLYGISPYENSGAPLKPVAAFRTRIISLKTWEPDTYIGYGNRGCTERKSVIATIPVGYADGVDRHLGRGRASFVVKGYECPTIGNICMDLCMIDVTDVPDVAIGDSVEIFGPRMPIERIAEILDTIPYEVLTSVSPRVKRQYSRK